MGMGWDWDKLYMVLVGWSGVLVIENDSTIIQYFVYMPQLRGYMG